MEPAIQLREVRGREKSDGERVIRTYLVYISADDRTIFTFHSLDSPHLHGHRTSGGIYAHTFTLIRLPPRFLEGNFQEVSHIFSKKQTTKQSQPVNILPFLSPCCSPERVLHHCRSYRSSRTRILPCSGQSL